MKSILLILLSIISSMSLAQDNIEARFRQAALTAVQEARARGFTSIDGLDLSDIEKSIREVNIVSHSNIKLHFANRRCAVWYNTRGGLVTTASGQKEKFIPHIYVNKSCGELPDAQLKGVALHEVLGVVYGLDLEYEFSARLMSDAAIAQRIDLRKNQIELHAGRGGSSTGVGGGGDYDDLKFKIYGLKKLDQTPNYAGFSNDILAKQLLTMKIAAARNIEKLVEYRGPGVELEVSKTYIHTETYRADEKENLGLLAMIVSSLDVLQAQGLLSPSYNTDLIKIHLR